MVSSSAAFGGGEILQFKRRYPHPLEKQVNVCLRIPKSGEIHPEDYIYVTLRHLYCQIGKKGEKN